MKDKTEVCRKWVQSTDSPLILWPVYKLQSLWVQKLTLQSWRCKCHGSSSLNITAEGKVNGDILRVRVGEQSHQGDRGMWKPSRQENGAQLHFVSLVSCSNSVNSQQILQSKKYNIRESSDKKTNAIDEII